MKVSSFLSFHVNSQEINKTYESISQLLYSNIHLVLYCMKHHCSRPNRWGNGHAVYIFNVQKLKIMVQIEWNLWVPQRTSYSQVALVKIINIKGCWQKICNFDCWTPFWHTNKARDWHYPSLQYFIQDKLRKVMGGFPQLCFPFYCTKYWLLVEK